MSDESVCFVPEGYEENVAYALGCGFKLEDCGILAKCDHKIEKYEYVNGQKVYAQWYQCSMNYAYVGGILAASIVLLFVARYAYKRWIRNKVKKAVGMGGDDE